MFDEERYFNHGEAACTFELGGVKFALSICADVWQEEAAHRAHRAGAQVLLVLNASPYYLDKQRARHKAVRERISETGMAVVYANLLGGQDELVFDGGSFVMDAQGALTHQFPHFEEVLGMVEVVAACRRRARSRPPCRKRKAYIALCAWECRTTSARTVSRAWCWDCPAAWIPR